MSKIILPSKFTNFAIKLANFEIFKDSPVPILNIGSLFLKFFLNFFLGIFRQVIIASAKSLVCINSLIGFPVPNK